MEDSLLVKSFWAGKMIQGLHLTTMDELNRLPMPSSPHHTPSHHQGQETSPASPNVVDAFHCISQSKTSLSQKVQQTLASGKGEHSNKENPLLDDGTLNWNRILKYFEMSKIASLIIFTVMYY